MSTKKPMKILEDMALSIIEKIHNMRVFNYRNPENDNKSWSFTITPEDIRKVDGVTRVKPAHSVGMAKVLSKECAISTTIEDGIITVTVLPIGSKQITVYTLSELDRRLDADEKREAYQTQTK